jgi:hypothetical protein
MAKKEKNSLELLVLALIIVSGVSLILILSPASSPTGMATKKNVLFQDSPDDMGKEAVKVMEKSPSLPDEDIGQRNAKNTSQKRELK